MKSRNFDTAEDSWFQRCEAVYSGRYLHDVSQEPVVSICRVEKNGPDTLVLNYQVTWHHVLEVQSAYSLPCEPLLKLLIVQFFPATFYFLCLRSKYCLLSILFL